MNHWRDVGLRALKTGVQAALAILVASGTGYVHVATLKAAAVALGAAALSALQNAISGSEAPPPPAPKPPA